VSSAQLLDASETPLRQHLVAIRRNVQNILSAEATPGTIKIYQQTTPTRPKNSSGSRLVAGLVAMGGMLGVAGFGAALLTSEQRRPTPAPRPVQQSSDREPARESQTDGNRSRESESSTEEARAEYEAWSSQPFDSRISQQIREAATGLDSPLAESLRGFRLTTMPAYWQKESTAVGAAIYPADAKWTGELGYGTPIQINDHTYALIEKHKGVSFSLWHVDTQACMLRKLRSYNDTPAAEAVHQFEDVAWHKTDGRVIGEFIVLNIDGESKSSHAGNVIIGELDAESGVIETKTDKKKFMPTREKLKEVLFAKRRSAETAFIPPTLVESLAEIDAQLSGRLMKFDALKWQIHISSAVMLRMHELGFHKACKIATVEAMDAFVAWAPNSIQAPEASKLAFQLEEERVTSSVGQARDSDDAAEQIVRELATAWRLNRKKKHVAAAERCYELLTTHPVLKTTRTALDVSKGKELAEFRDELQAFQRQNQISLSSIKAAQSEQMDIIRNQLPIAGQTNRSVNYIGGQIAYLREGAEGFEAMFDSRMPSSSEGPRGVRVDN